ncbi:MAG: WYL domain-containing transcriptional regulator [Nitrospira sp.]|nr:WYL domain-containing transcriptional regulator [Nitrospira sp.]
MPTHKGRRPKPYSQAARINLMVRRLTGGATISELAEEFHITKRQVHRDLQHLEESGFPLLQEDGRYRLPPGFRGMEIVVSPFELMSLYLAKSHLNYLQDTSLFDDFNSILRKIEVGLPDRVKNHIERIVTAFEPLQRPARAYAEKKTVLHALRKAVLHQRTAVLLGYRKPGAEQPTNYRVDPYGLVLYQYGLYVVGYSHETDAIRIFAVERIEDIEVTEEIFEIPRSFSLSERVERGFGLIDDSSQEVEIWIAPEWAYFVKERRWHPTQSLQPQKDGSVILTMQCGGLDELTAWVLSLGPGAKVLGPQALIDLVSGQLRAAANSYRSSC